MKIGLSHSLAIIVVALGLVVGPAAHRVHHSMEYHATARAVLSSGHAHGSTAGLCYPLPRNGYDETICVLCQLLDGQIILEQALWTEPDSEISGIATARDVVVTSPTDQPSGRAPPYLA